MRKLSHLPFFFLCVGQSIGCNTFSIYHGPEKGIMFAAF